MQVKVKKLHPDAKLPVYGSDGAGAFDIFSAPDTLYMEVRQGAPAIVGTGLQFEVPEGHCMFIVGRSGHGFKNATRLSNVIGVIDSDYRGEVKVKLTRDHDLCATYMQINPCERIAQGFILPMPRIEFVEAEELSDTERGAGGFGSTGEK